METKNDELERKRPPFTIIENAIIENQKLSIYAFAVYVVLCKFANQGGKAWPGYKTIANMAKCSRRKAVQAIEELIQAGYISKEIRLTEKREYTSNLYTILAQYEYTPKNTNYSLGSARGAPPLVNVMHHPGARGAPKLYPIEQEPKEGRKDHPSVPPSVRKKIAAIRSDRYSKANDLERVFTARGLDVTAHVEQDKDNFYRAYRFFIRDDSPGLCKRNHPLALFLNQYPEWIAKSSPVQEYLDYDGADKEKAPPPTDEERKEGVKILQNWKQDMKTEGKRELA